MIEVWGRPNSNNVMSVMWTIGELGLDHVRHNIGGTFGGLDSPDYLAMNPNGRIPVMRDNGNTLWESTTIVRYLGAAYDDGSFWPRDIYQRAVAEQWMDWFKSTFYPAFIPIFWGMIRTPANERNQQAIDQSIAGVGSVMQILENHLSNQPWLAGDAFTLGDVPVGACAYRYFNLEIDRPSLPALEDWYRRLCERPAYQQHVMIPFGRSNEEWLALEKQFA